MEQRDINNQDRKKKKFLVSRNVGIRNNLLQIISHHKRVICVEFRGRSKKFRAR